MHNRQIGSVLILAMLLFAVGCERSAPPPPAAVAELPEPVEPTGDCVLTMGWDPWEPYHYEDIDGTVRGMEVDLVQTIAAGAGCRIELQRGQWGQLLRGLMAGDIDVLGGATATAEREDFAHFSSPYREESFRLFVRSGELSTYAGDTLEDVLANGMRLGITQGYVYSDEVSGLQDNPDYANLFIESPEAGFSFVALNENAVDGVLEDAYVAAAILRRRGWQDDIQQHPLDLGSNAVSLMFSRASVDEEVVTRFNRSLAALKSNGELDRIIARYRIE
jgi:polar amino acid transport system substrate-binding protein